MRPWRRRELMRNPKVIRQVDSAADPILRVIVDPGAASAKEIADVLSDLSILYRRIGGSGINFTPDDAHVLIPTRP
jgi:hypothetical protein